MAGEVQMSAEMLVDLQLAYGAHEYDYPHLSDFNIQSVIKKHGCKTFEEFDRACKRLDQVVAEIEEMKGACKE